MGNNLFVGSNGSFNRLVVSNGALLRNSLGYVGYNPSSSNNEAVVTGSGSLWTNAGAFFAVGYFGPGNRLVVSNGGVVRGGQVYLGFNSSKNVAVVTGSGSVWSNSFQLFIGFVGGSNQFVVSNGAVVLSDSGYLGFRDTSSDNEAVVTGPGSFWINFGDLDVGESGSRNRLVVSNEGSVSATGIIVGNETSSTNNRISVDGGTLQAFDGFGNGVLDVRRGTTVLNAGLIEVDRLLLTNTQGFLQFNSGTLSARDSRVSNGTIFAVGNGVSPATFILAGNGVHEFNVLLTAQVRSNATFTGNGTIVGSVALQFLSGSRLIPGASVGKMVFSNSPSLQGAVIMEISKNGATLTNDQIQVTGTLTYGGSLTVSNLGPTALAAGNRFPLFSATSYAGSFSNISLPPLAFGLDWTNKLGVDGSIQVVSTGTAPPTITIQVSNNLATVSWPTNASCFCLEAAFDLTPPVFWQPITDGIAVSGSSFVFTLPDNPTVARQFFRLACPCSIAPAADGFATVGGNTTGGGGGPIVTVSTTADFLFYVTNPSPCVIQVLGTINVSVDEAQVGDNKTIIGVGPNPTVIGELELDGSTNVIIHNLFIENDDDDDGRSGTGDGVRIIGGSHHIWVDHCTFTDCADGSLDTTQGSDLITVSWCKFNYTRDNGHNYVNLIGNSDSDTGNYRLTFHHNWWSTLCKQRMPSQRFGQCHMYNNYFNTVTNDHCSVVRLQAQMLSENNFYDTVIHPIFEGFGSTGQSIRTVGNVYFNCTGAIDPGTDLAFMPPYAYTLDQTADVPSIVTNGAGASSP